MTTTVRDAAQQQGTGPVAMIERYRGDLATVLPSHLAANADTWVRVAMGAIRKSSDLFTACKTNPNSMMSALMEAARLGLEPGTEEYHLTPRKVKGQWSVLGIVGYQGEVELMYRAGAVASVTAELVRERDTFIWRPGAYDTQRPPRWEGPQTQPYHDVDWFGDRGAVRGSYAYAVMKDTGAISKVVVVGEERIKRAMAASGTADSSHSPWKSDYGAMVLKTAAHDLAKWVPTSAEYRREQLRAAATVAAETARPAPDAAGFVPPPADPDVIDGEVVEPARGVIVDITEPAPRTPQTVATEQEPAEPPAAPSKRPSKTRMNKLFALLSEAGLTSTEKRHRLATHVLDKDVNSFSDLSAAEVDDLIRRLEQLRAEGKFPADQDEPPPDEPPADEPEQQHADTEGDAK